MKFKKYFLLSWKRLLIVIGAWFLAVILHNLIYGLFYDFFSSTGGDEPVFFIIATLIIPIYFIISVVYTIFYYIRKKK